MFSRDGWQLLPLVLLFAVIGWTQTYTASVRGIISDPAGAVVPGAQVVVLEVDRNIEHKTVSDGEGRYFVTALPPGRYSISVEAPGFRKYVQGPFPLSVQQQASVNVQLEVGEVTATVEVVGQAPLLNTTSATLGQVIENKYILSLPNIGRTPMAYTYLTPGVVGSGGRIGQTNTNFVAGGTRNSSADVLIDGVTTTVVEQNSGITDLKFTPSVDAVQEFKVQTNFFAAEYGQTGGAVINMVTRSGTNEFHGTGYYFLRHSDLNANSWFSNRAGRERPFYRRDQFGGVLGGPIAKDKTFFFATYEYTRAKSPTTQTATFPTPLQREGNFSETRNTAGQIMTVFNPFDTFTNAQGNLERRPFPGNVVPKSMFDPVSLKALAYFPLPNQPGHPVTQTSNWYEQGVGLSTSHQLNAKVDHNFTANSRLSGRYSYAPSKYNPPNLFGDLRAALPWNLGPSSNKPTSVVAEFTKVRSATDLWSVRYGLIYADYWRNPFEEFQLTKLGLPQYMLDNATHKVFPTFSPEGYNEIGVQGWHIMDRQEGTHHFSGFYSKVAGGHSMKFGAETRRRWLDYAQPGYPSGQFSFGRGVTCRDRFSCPANEGNGFAAFLIGWATGGQFHIDPKVFSRSSYWGFYFQDDWRLTPKFTLNLGVRYEFDLPVWEKFNRESYWDLEAQSPVKVQGYDTRGIYRFVDDNHRSPFQGDYNNWSPRIGLAYAATNKLAIRAGYGLLYQLSRNTVHGHTGSGFVVNSTPTFTRDSNATLYARLSHPYPDGMLLPPGNSLKEWTFIGLGAGTIVPHWSSNPEYHSWNLSIQYALPVQSVLEVNYTGTRGTNLMLPYNSLTPLHPQYWALGRTQLTSAVPNPFYGIITDPRSQLSRSTVQLYRLLRPMPHFDGAGGSYSMPPAADSYYHALQIKWEKRYSHGLTLLTHYTFSKMIDTASHGSGNLSWLGGDTSFQDPLNLRLERALSAHDVKHRGVITFAWEVPIGRGRALGSDWNRWLDALIGGWELSGYVLLQSGMPLQVTQSGGNIWNGTQRPDLIGDPSTSGPIVDRLYRYFNEAAFSKPPIDVRGTAPRTLNYRSPAVRSFDAALLKNFRIREGQRFEFRLEAQNAFNHTIFGNPNTSFGSTAFGQITGYQWGAGPRNVQLGMKYYF